ncbi:restriction endonuclease subunit S [Escherichia coli]|uniref:restriction endonuclease subunit S n=1 Tax=Escherichia coli TaxID=562 RepID=UPI00052D8568|nr:restriction endonuclease subunit S [Escherichia coli]EAB8121091.1 restriction endonuclease subunit S [Escherichia coli]EAC0074293.1 restriction endonuclease subunit S [Escherichia coli]EEV9029417.1 restriction endonuclease subunit S [Escherichia coli]EFN4118678.1 restriction endonuclease subunit S [Escherichia coli]EGD4888563.1 restriction endonuclease subunit S [Escherichia coli]
MSSNYREQWTSVGGHFPSHWQFFKLEELLENAKGIAVGVMYPGDHTAEGIPLIKVGDVKDGYIASQPSFFISPEVDEEYKRTRLNGTELLITLVGNPGDCVVVEPYMAGWNAARALAVVRLKDTGLREWLKYILLSKPAKHLIDARLNTTVQKTLNLKDIRELGIPIPPKHERDMIIKNISAIEQKKIVNADTNQTLEQMAQALFKSWFVDFEPVKAKMAVLAAGGSQEEATLAAMTAISGKNADALAVFEREHPEQYAELKATAELFPLAMQDSELGEIPEGWSIKPLDGIATYQNGLALQKFRPENENDFLPVVKIAQLKKGFSDGEEKASPNIKPECIIDNGDVVFSWSGSLMVDIWCGGKAALNQHLFKVSSTKYPKWLYYKYTAHHLIEFQRIAEAKAVTMGHIKREHLSQAKCLIPSSETVHAFTPFFEPVLNKVISNRLETRKLENIRDTLLPKLLSGEITLPEAEQAESEAENV